MENEYLIFFVAVLSITVLICFFVLCANVAKLVKLTNEKVNDYNEYLVFEKMGEKEKAYYHLKRALAKQQLMGINDYTIKAFIKDFEKLGVGIPDMEILKKEENK